VKVVVGNNLSSHINVININFKLIKKWNNLYFSLQNLTT
jgi:hypothetical protein